MIGYNLKSSNLEMKGFVPQEYLRNRMQTIG